MKLNYLLLLYSILLCFSSCKVENQCVPPPCTKPDINQSLSIELDFCDVDQSDNCFSEKDLALVSVVSKHNFDNSIISIDSLLSLKKFNNTITLGKNGIPLITNEINPTSIDLNFEVVVIETGHHFTISNIEIADINRDNLCECPAYHIVQLKLNDKLIEVKSPLAELKLKK